VAAVDASLSGSGAQDASETTSPPGKKRKPRGGFGTISRLSRRDKATVYLMVGIPTVLVVFLVVIPAIMSVVLSFASWEGIETASAGTNNDAENPLTAELVACADYWRRHVRAPVSSTPDALLSYFLSALATPPLDPSVRAELSSYLRATGAWTGSDDPARNGKPRRFASATISAHSRQLVERCLSLKTGTARPFS